MRCHANGAQSDRPSVATAFAGGALDGWRLLHHPFSADRSRRRRWRVLNLTSAAGHRVVVRSDSRRWSNIPRQRSTYASQLRAFTGAILWREPVLTDQTTRSPTCRLSTRATQRLSNRGENLASDGSALLRDGGRRECRGNDWSSVGPHRLSTSPTTWAKSDLHTHGGL